MGEAEVRKRKPIRPETDSKADGAKKKKGGKKPFGMLRLFSLLFAGGSALLMSLVLLCENKIQAIYHELPEPGSFIGPLTENDLLLKAEHVLTGQIGGPESLLLHKDSIFTGTKDGKVVEIKNDKIVRVIHSLGNSDFCDYDGEPTCGRPLGLRMFDENTIVYVDAYLGLFKLNIETGKSEMLVKGGSTVDGKRLTFLNDLVVLKDGTILFTDSSSKHPRRDFMLNLLEHTQDGRVLAFDTKTKTTRVLLSDLAFPNGIEVSSNEDFVLISELTNARILKFYLKGAKAGKTDVFLANLPGCPDNIRLSKNGSFWVGMAMARKLGMLSVVDFLSTKPALSNFIAKIVPVRLWSTLAAIFPSYGLAILIDPNGKIVSSLHDSTGKNVPRVSEVADTGNTLYFGSYDAPYLSKLKYKRIS